MTPDEFRALALALPEALEGQHQGHPDFRVGGKVFATLGPDEDWGMLKLDPDAQADWVEAEPDVFEPFAGAWGRQGCTRVTLAAASAERVGLALRAAWCNVAPEALTAQHPDLCG